MILKKPASHLDGEVDTGFPKTSCSGKKIERDDYSKRVIPR
jgi:hypothetical protein